jgi:DNA invertase Pin-like site-specific DNA recombinase
VILIALRTSDGRERAKKAGVKFGPKPKLSGHQIQEIRLRKELGESCRFLARSSMKSHPIRLAELSDPSVSHWWGKEAASSR